MPDLVCLPHVRSSATIDAIQAARPKLAVVDAAKENVPLSTNDREIPALVIDNFCMKCTNSTCESTYGIQGQGSFHFICPTQETDHQLAPTLLAELH